jgi:hypothetical protein
MDAALLWDPPAGVCWSVTDLEGFWQAVWDFYELTFGELGEQVAPRHVPGIDAFVVFSEGRGR